MPYLDSIIPSKSFYLGFNRNIFRLTRTTIFQRDSKTLIKGMMRKEVKQLDFAPL